MSDGRIRVTISVECDSETLAQALEALFNQIAAKELPKPEPRFEDVPAATSLRPTNPHVHSFRRRRL